MCTGGRTPRTSTPTRSIPTTPEYFAHGTTARLTAYADPDFYFTGWTALIDNQPVVVSTDNPWTLTLTKDTAVTATFEATTPQVFYVNELTDAALRDAIQQSNGNPGTDEIIFTLSGPLYLSSPLPLLADGVEITVDAGDGSKVTIMPGTGFAGNHESSGWVPALRSLPWLWLYTSAEHDQKPDHHGL